MPRPIKGADGSTMCMKRCAYSAVWPLAPSKPSSVPTQGHISAAPSASASAIQARVAAANRRARAWSPWPSARATSADTAIDRPMASEVMKNSSVPA